MKNLRAIMRDPAKNQIMASHYTKISIMVIHSLNGLPKNDTQMLIKKRQLVLIFMDLSMLEKAAFLLNYKNMDAG